jgi:UDP-N-acetyl-D-mannosaminuronic acid transferase (WecB/TagA/CpsF family)
MSPDAMAHYIEIHKIDYAFSCLGMKTQESTLIDIWQYLPSYTHVVGIGVGASIDFLLGIQKRAPWIFQAL